jgi:hypothetical protein
MSGPSRSLLGASLVLCLAGCKDGDDEPQPPRGADEERTVVTVQSYVYAEQSDTNQKVVGRIRDQIRSAFGALKSLRVTGSNKDVSNEAGGQLYREPLVLVRQDESETLVVRVWFRYSDEVIAPASVPRGVPMLVGGLHRQDEARFERIVIACTANSMREREYRGRLQAVFDGSLATCQDAILGEQAVIDAARVRLDSPEDETVPEEFDRLYVPVVARLLGRKATQMGDYPRFEAVMPQAGGMVAAAAPAVGRTRGAPGHEGSDGPDDGKPGAGAEGDARPDKPTPLVIPGAGAGEPRPAGAAAQEEPQNPDAPPELPVGSPVVVDAPKGPGTPIQPRGEGIGSFEWDDLLDKRFLALWIAVFALYPLLRRRSGG